MSTVPGLDWWHGRRGGVLLYHTVAPFYWIVEAIWMIAASTVFVSYCMHCTEVLYYDQEMITRVECSRR